VHLAHVFCRLNVMAQDEVNILQLQARQALVHTPAVTKGFLKLNYSSSSPQARLNFGHTLCQHSLWECVSPSHTPCGKTKARTWPLKFKLGIGHAPSNPPKQKLLEQWLLIIYALGCEPCDSWCAEGWNTACWRWRWKYSMNGRYSHFSPGNPISAEVLVLPGLVLAHLGCHKDFLSGEVLDASAEKLQATTRSWIWTRCFLERTLVVKQTPPIGGTFAQHRPTAAMPLAKTVIPLDPLAKTVIPLAKTVIPLDPLAKTVIPLAKTVISPDPLAKTVISLDLLSNGARGPSFPQKAHT